MQQFSRVRDPLTGVRRQVSAFTTRLIELDFRHDVLKSDWAWGASLEYSRQSLAYRLNEVGRQYEGPIFTSLFVENKDVLGLTVRSEVINLNNARSRWDRIVYSGRRNVSPIEFVEDRNRLIGPIFRFSVRGTF